MPSPQSARFSPSFSRSLPLSNGTNLRFLRCWTECCTERRSIVSEVTTHSRVRLSLLRRDRFMNHLLCSSIVLSSPSLSPSSSPPPSLSLLVSFLFLSRNPSRTYRFTRSVYVSIRDPAVEYLFSTIKAIPRRDTHYVVIRKKRKKNVNAKEGIFFKRSRYMSQGAMSRLLPDGFVSHV